MSQGDLAQRWDGAGQGVSLPVLLWGRVLVHECPSGRLFHVFCPDHCLLGAVWCSSRAGVRVSWLSPARFPAHGSRRDTLSERSSLAAGDLFHSPWSPHSSGGSCSWFRSRLEPQMSCFSAGLMPACIVMMLTLGSVKR